MNVFAFLVLGIFMNTSLGFVILSMAPKMELEVLIISLFLATASLYFLLNHISKNPQLKMEKEGENKNDI